MEFDLSQIKLSCYDRKRGLILPNRPSEELAEFIGILAGDGHVSFSTKRYHISIAGDSRFDINYLEYVKNLIKKLFNLDINMSVRKRANAAVIEFESKGVLSLLRYIGYYKHKSRNIKFPDWIMENDDYLLNTIKGLADTDFSLMLYKNRKTYPYYPIIAIASVDKEFLILISKFLERLGFNVDLFDDKSFDKRFGKTWSKAILRLSGRQNLDLWMKLIGFRNRRHLDKYEEYLKSGVILKNIGRPQLNITGLKHE